MSLFIVFFAQGLVYDPNRHLRDIPLPLKAKGLLSLMLPLPENADMIRTKLDLICINRSGVLNCSAYFWISSGDRDAKSSSPSPTTWKVPVTIS